MHSRGLVFLCRRQREKSWCIIANSIGGAKSHSFRSNRQWSPHAQAVCVAIFTGLSHLSCLRILGILGWTCGGNTADPKRNCVICIPIHKVLISKIYLIRPWGGRRVSQLPKLGFCLVVKKCVLRVYFVFVGCSTIPLPRLMTCAAQQ